MNAVEPLILIAGLPPKQSLKKHDLTVVFISCQLVTPVKQFLVQLHNMIIVSCIVVVVFDIWQQVWFHRVKQILTVHILAGTPIKHLRFDQNSQQLFLWSDAMCEHSNGTT